MLTIFGKMHSSRTTETDMEGDLRYTNIPLVALALLFPWLSSATDAISIAHQISKLTASQFHERKFEAINAREHEYRTAQSRLPDGRWKLTFIYRELGVVSKRGAEGEWKREIDLVDEWIRTTPNQPAPYLAKAEILIAYAWDARGDGRASTVSSKQWNLFRQRIAEARKVLEQSYEIAKENPYWFLKMEVIAIAQGWSEEEFDALYQRATKAAPTYYFIHFAAADYYLPRWHGSKEKLRRFVDHAVAKSKSQEGMTLYTRIYWSTLWALKKNTFSEGYAEWGDMRLGFKDIMQQYPDSSWNLNAYAYYACMAEDWTTMRRLSAQISDQPHLSIWRSTLAYQTCQRLSREHP